MIVLPLGEELPPATAARPRTDAKPTIVKLLALGFSPSERKLIQGVVALSQRRSLHVELVEAETWTLADVILLDGADAKVAAWAAGQPSLSRMTVIWVDGRNAAAGGPTQLKRPVQWPTLPALLQRALGLEITDSSRQQLSAH